MPVASDALAAKRLLSRAVEMYDVPIEKLLFSKTLLTTCTCANSCFAPYDPIFGGRLTSLCCLFSSPLGYGSIVETDKGDIPIRKEYFQLWYIQGTPYALYDNYAYVTL